MDSTALDEIREAMGETRTLDLLANLATDLSCRFGSEAPQDLAFDAHATLGTAGLFGFRTLASVCREVEAACRSGADVTPLRARLNEERRRALHHIEAMRRAA